MRLLGKVIINCQLEAETGLAVGAGKEALEIGGLDNPVVKSPKGIPYLPGSSIKGKLRSLIERKSFDLSPLKKYRDEEARYDQELKAIEKEKGKNSSEYKEKEKERNRVLNDERERIKDENWRYVGGPFIHICSSRDCDVCTIFGRPGEEESAEPTRLYVRDAFLDEEDFKQKFPELAESNLFTEAKWENAIDRLTSSANPRNFERVPAGSKFNCEFIFNFYEKKDIERFNKFIETLRWLEDDYLGSSGSRGYGKVKFGNIEIKVKNAKDYEEGRDVISEAINSLDELVKRQDKIIGKIEVSD